MFCKTFLTLYALLCFGASQLHGACPAGYTQANSGKCYKLHAEKKSWNDAFQRCSGENSHLVFIEGNDDVEDLKKILNSAPGCANPVVAGLGAWTGGRKSSNQLYWNGPGRAKSTVCYTNWRQGEPNNFSNSEDCVQIYNDGTWNDLGCEHLLCLICEADV